jgi:peptidyl-prolyl cis-trans isomerase SurA
MLKKNPSAWRKTSESFSEKVVADSARYEWEQIPNLNKSVPRAGMVTSPLINTNDNTAAFAYIIRVYPEVMQRTFNEARGLVMNDYQALLEQRWNEALRNKYPVVIDEKVLASISK